MQTRLKRLRYLICLAVAGVAGAQSNFDVTMRVVDDARGLNAVEIVIGADAIEIRSEQAPPVDAAPAAQ